MKIAVVLFNLGGPDSLDSVKPFLKNLFSDPAILRVPHLLRKFLAWYISYKRTPFAQKIYAQMGGKSPILEETKRQSELLENFLNENSDQDLQYKCFIGMRYWHPFVEEAFESVKQWKADKVVLLPLYPQFSTTTTASSVTEWKRCEKEKNKTFNSVTICCYPRQDGVVEGYGEKIESLLNSMSPDTMQKARILFSAHGLPKKVIQDGDPYEKQVNRTAIEIINYLSRKGFNNLNSTVCYQSKVGRLEWLKPSTEEEIIKAGQDGKGIIICPIAFVSEHSETKVELDIEYKELAHEKGVPFYYRIPTLSSDPKYIQGLAELVMKYYHQNDNVSDCKEDCKGFSRCLRNRD